MSPRELDSVIVCKVGFLAFEISRPRHRSARKQAPNSYGRLEPQLIDLRMFLDLRATKLAFLTGTYSHAGSPSGTDAANTKNDETQLERFF
jgi:hypothetical protein